MTWWKMFGSTFILIFLAELGDKTQLAAMARVADGPDGSAAKWAVFLAASSALVLSTLIAVFFGGFLRSLVPDERYIKIVAGILFLIFGAWILTDVFRSFSGKNEKTPPPAPEASAKTGYLGGLALRAALDFESAMADKYRRLAEDADFELSGLLSQLAKEEDGHLSRLSRLSPGERKDAFAPERAIDAMPDSFGFSGNADPDPDARIEIMGLNNRIASALQHKAAENTPASQSGQTPDLNLVRDLANHENAAAEFYQSLAEQTLVPSLKPIFSRLAEEERGHAARIERYIRSREERRG